MSVLEAILAVFTEVGEWIPGAVQAMIPIFWTAGSNGEGTLTFMGVLAVAGLAFSVIFLEGLSLLLKSTGHIQSDLDCESSLIAGTSL